MSKHFGETNPGKRLTPGQLSFQQFVRDHLETGVLMSVALVLTHPEQYALTRASLEKLAHLPVICKRIREWAFGFNVLTIVANRESYLHRDKESGGPEYIDELLSIGGNHKTVLELPGIGVRFRHASGTMALFSGNTHLHGVSRSTTERVCFAAYVHSSVHRKFRIPAPNPPSLVSSMQYVYWNSYINSLLEWARS